MNFKSCIYKNCENYSLDGVSTGNHTFFSLPKDPIRRKEWLELCGAPNDLPNDAYYMCSQHFEQKYISQSGRRKFLIGPAKPNPYNEKQVPAVEQTTKDNNYIILNSNRKSTARLVNEEQDFAVESTTKSYNDDSTSMQLQKNYEIEDMGSDKIIQDQYNEHDIIIELCASEPSKHCATLEEDAEFLVDRSQVATFIFKNEEYVQMPKSYYVQEKSKLIQQVLHYKSILDNIKLQLNDLKD